MKKDSGLIRFGLLLVSACSGLVTSGFSFPFEATISVPLDGNGDTATYQVKGPISARSFATTLKFYTSFHTLGCPSGNSGDFIGFQKNPTNATYPFYNYGNNWCGTGGRGGRWYEFYYDRFEYRIPWNQKTVYMKINKHSQDSMLVTVTSRLDSSEINIRFDTLSQIQPSSALNHKHLEKSQIGPRRDVLGRIEATEKSVIINRRIGKRIFKTPPKK